eukprot:snap_masked-scaffold_24-processed-gene-5.40-mRNA-1 protein AED:0.76 eAED:0.76 QI:0/-1/0/1/-1/1/1/0/114
MITLSTAEAEFVSLSQCMKKLRMLLQYLEFYEVEVELPIQVEINNQPATQMLKGGRSVHRTKYIDVHLLHCRELLKRKIIQVKYIQSEKNVSDILTKCCAPEVYKNLLPNLISV